MSVKTEAADAVLEAVKRLAEQNCSASELRDLAEAVSLVGGRGSSGDGQQPRRAVVM